MMLHQQNGLLYGTFQNLSSFHKIRHAVFTKINQRHSDHDMGLNVSRSVGDDPYRVRINRDAVARIMGAGSMIFVHQIHQTDILMVDGFVTASSASSHLETLSGDALITTCPGVFIAIKLGDCQSVMMYDPVKQVIANVHCGWRGSIQNIIGRCIAAMKNTFNTNPEHIVAGISPSLGPCCAEFIHYQNEIPEKFWKYKDSRDHFNFWAVSRDQLTESGVKSENIETANICTKCNAHLFYSYRQCKNSGRFAAVIGMKG